MEAVLPWDDKVAAQNSGHELPVGAGFGREPQTRRGFPSSAVQRETGNPPDRGHAGPPQVLELAGVKD